MDQQNQPYRMKRTRTVYKSKQSRESNEEPPSKREIVQQRNGQRKIRFRTNHMKGDKLGKKKSKSKHKIRKQSRSARKESRSARKESRQARKESRQARKERKQARKQRKQGRKEERQVNNEPRQEDLKVEDKQTSKPTDNNKMQKSATLQQDKDIKQQEGKGEARKPKSKSKSKSRTKQKKLKKNKKPNDQVKNEAEGQRQEEQIPENLQQPKPKKKKSAKSAKNSKKKTTDNEIDKAEQINVDQIKLEQDYNWQANNNDHNDKVKIRKKEMLCFEDSQKIIHLFSLDAGDYRGMRKQMPHIAQRQIRGHLRMLFQRSLNMITERVREGGRKIKDWEQYERREIIRELHRIRSSNRLLSEGNVELRQTFLKMMSSFNHPQIDLTDAEIVFLYRKIEAFVRGFNHLNFFRKNYYVAPDEQDQRRKPIIQGGYIMQSKVKREQRKRNEYHQVLRNKIDPDQLVLEWTELQERELSILYLKNITNYEHMIENLKARFGDSDKWRDFQIVGKKIDHLIKLGLDRLQEITSKSYYDPAQLMAEQKARSIKKDSQRRKKIDRIKKSGPNTLQDLTSVVYNNKQIIKQTREVRQGGVIKNPSLLLKQVFAHVESYRVKHRLVDLVVNRYPDESDIQETIRIIKEFTEWANRQEEKNGVTLIRSRPPVIDYGHHSQQAFSCREDRSVTQLNKEQDESAMIFQRGLNYLEPTSEDQKKEYDDSPVYFSGKADGVFQGVESLTECRSNVVQVFQSDESDYEGFVKSTK